MRPSTYERVRRENPRIQLPLWEAMSVNNRKKARRLNVEQLIKARIVRLLEGVRITPQKEQDWWSREFDRRAGIQAYEAKKAARLAKINKPVNVQSKEISESK